MALKSLSTMLMTSPTLGGVPTAATGTVAPLARGGDVPPRWGWKSTDCSPSGLARMTLADTSPGRLLPGSSDTLTVTDRLSGLSFTDVTVPTVTPLLLADRPLMSPETLTLCCQA